MKKLHLISVAALACGFAAPVLAEKATSETNAKTTVERDADGAYHKKQTSTMENTNTEGTTTKAQTKVEVDSDADGNAERKVTTETSTDPKGLMNKSKTTTSDTVKYEDGKVEKKYKKTVDGKTVEEHSEKNSAN